jgi:hypothetical protein
VRKRSRNVTLPRKTCNHKSILVSSPALLKSGSCSFGVISDVLRGR